MLYMCSNLLLFTLQVTIGTFVWVLCWDQYNILLALFFLIVTKCCKLAHLSMSGNVVLERAFIKIWLSSCVQC